MKRSSPLKRKTPLRSKSQLSRGSGLQRKSRLKRRSLAERTKDDPDRYGDLFEAVRRMPCFGRKYLPGHECELGYAPASAHHLGRQDSEGMVPVCGRLHDLCEMRTSEVEVMLQRAGSPSLEELGQMYVERAREGAGDG